MARETTNKGAGHRQRLRERFLQAGLSGFHDYEVLELLLTLNTPRKDTKQAAKDLLAEFKTLPRVLEANTQALCRVKGVGPANSFGIHLIKAVADRYLETRIIKMDVVSNPESLIAYLNQTIGYKNKEHFLGIFLDAKNKVLATEVLFEGTLTASAVYPREVVRAALDHRAAALILAHNHPSGQLEPSQDDRFVTQQIKVAGDLLGIGLLDHIIFTTKGHYSFAEHGEL